MSDSYGKNPGEVVAAAHIDASAAIVGEAFNVVSATAISPGVVGVLLLDGVDQIDCAVEVTCDTSPETATANDGGLDTDTLKRVTLASGESTSGFYIVVVRTAVGVG